MATIPSLTFKYGKKLTDATDFQEGTIFLDIENNELFYDDPEGVTRSHQKIIDSNIYNIKYTRDPSFQISTSTKIGTFYNSENETTDIYIPKLSGGTAATNDATLVGGVTVSGHAITVTKKTIVGGGTTTIADNANKITISSSGTNVTLNGVDKSGSTASFYAPTKAGTADQILLSGGVNTEPSWANSAPYADALSSAVTINDTTFQKAGDNITTKKWGTARNINIVNSDGTDGSQAVSIDGSITSYSLNLPETIKAITINATTINGTTINGDLNGDVTGNLEGLAKNASNIRMTLTNPSISKTYYPTWVTDYEAGTNYALRGNDGCKYMTLEGVAGTAGYGYLILGNGIAQESAGGKYGALRLYGTGTTYTNLRAYQPAASRTVYLRDYGATAYLVSTSATSAVGSTTGPVYINSSGLVKPCSVATSGSWFGALTSIGTDGVMEVGKYIDFHLSNTGTTDYDFRFTCDSSGVLKSSGKLYGAVWNDYAEFRKYKDGDQIPYGRIVVENGDDSLSLSTQRMQKGGNICSDTFGFAIGETEETQMPIAVSGRALAYTNEDRNSYEPGDAVCTGPNGTISKMTREEIKEYPDRIIGYVSAIPEYEIWGEQNITVDRRIWIKVV